MGPVRPVGQGFFPLDEELALLPVYWLLGTSVQKIDGYGLDLSF